MSRHGDKWYKIRTLVNPVMLQPKMVQCYTESINDITQDFIKYVLARDSNNQILNRDLNLWSLESIANITLDRRLGLFNKNSNRDVEDDTSMYDKFDIFTQLYSLNIILAFS